MAGEINLYDLPPEVQRWVKAIGLDAAMAIVEYYGGTPLYVPRVPGAEHQLVKLVGSEVAQKFCDLVPSGEILVPKCEAAMRRLQHERIAALLAEHSPAEVARRTGLHIRTIQRIRSARLDEQNNDQMGLF